MNNIIERNTIKIIKKNYHQIIKNRNIKHNLTSLINKELDKKIKTNELNIYVLILGIIDGNYNELETKELRNELLLKLKEINTVLNLELLDKVFDEKISQPYSRISIFALKKEYHVTKNKDTIDNFDLYEKFSESYEIGYYASDYIDMNKIIKLYNIVENNNYKKYIKK